MKHDYDYEYEDGKPKENETQFSKAFSITIAVVSIIGQYIFIDNDQVRIIISFIGFLCFILIYSIGIIKKKNIDKYEKMQSIASRSLIFALFIIVLTVLPEYVKEPQPTTTISNLADVSSNDYDNDIDLTTHAPTSEIFIDPIQLETQVPTPKETVASIQLETQAPTSKKTEEPIQMETQEPTPTISNAPTQAVTQPPTSTPSKPVSLFNFDYLSRGGFNDAKLNIKKSMKDNLGNQYGTGLSGIYNGFWEDEFYISYYLNNKFAKITGKAIIGYDTRSGKGEYCYVFYGDGDEIFRTPGIRGNKEPIDFEFSVEGVKTLQINLISIGSVYSSIEVGLVETYAHYK